ncbi:hypothetical protein [Ruminococcus bromii]|nr:hypothetical protein [Ruminococcus bromii]
MIKRIIITNRVKQIMYSICITSHQLIKPKLLLVEFSVDANRLNFPATP